MCLTVQSLQDNDMSEGQIIIHVDMDAFYASVEMRDDKTLIGKAAYYRFNAE